MRRGFSFSILSTHEKKDFEDRHHERKKSWTRLSEIRKLPGMWRKNKEGMLRWQIIRLAPSAERMLFITGLKKMGIVPGYLRVHKRGWFSITRPTPSPLQSPSAQQKKNPSATPNEVTVRVKTVWAPLTCRSVSRGGRIFLCLGETGQCFVFRV